MRPELYRRARFPTDRRRGVLAAGWNAPDEQAILGDTSGTEEVSVEVSLMGLYAGARLLERADIADALIMSGERAAMPEFYAQARSGMPEALLPFERDELDLAYAASMARSVHECLLRGASTRVEGGYFKFVTPLKGDASVRYVDRSGIEGRPLQVLLDPVHSSALLQKISAWPSALASLRFTAIENQWFQVGFADALSAVFLRKEPAMRRAMCVVSVVSRSRATFLTETEFHLEGTILRPLAWPVERLMELQAAALDDAWILIEHPEFCVLGPIPDLYEDGSESIARFEPTAAFNLWLGGFDQQTIPIKVSLARELVGRFHWMSAPHPVTWRLLVEASQ